MIMKSYLRTYFKQNIFPTQKIFSKEVKKMKKLTELVMLKIGKERL